MDIIECTVMYIENDESVVDGTEIIYYSNDGQQETPLPLPVLETPKKIDNSVTRRIESEIPSSAIKKEVAKFCHEIIYDSIEIHEEKASPIHVLETPRKVGDSVTQPIERDVPSSAIKKEVAKFCDEIDESSLDMVNSVTPAIQDAADANRAFEDAGIKIIPPDVFRDMKKEKKERNFECNDCGKRTTTKAYLSHHMATHLENVVFKCEKCNKGYFTQGAYTKHKKTSCEVGPFHCTLCSKEFQNKRYLTKHVNFIHNRIKKLKCSECDFTAISLYYLKRHAAKHWDEKPFKCPKCPYQTHLDLNFKRHETVHNDIKSMVCKVCGQAYKTDAALRRHVAGKHKFKSKNVCEFCSARLSDARKLKNHIRLLHNRDEPINCDQCQNTFVDKLAYMLHRKKKKSLNEYEECTVKLCSYKARSECALKTHLLTHFSAKPQICIVCNQTFQNTFDLKVHLYTHADLIKCSDCGENFNKKGKIQLHLSMPAEENQINENTARNFQEVDIKNEFDQYSMDDDQVRIKNEPDIKEPMVVLEVIKMVSEDGESHVQYNLTRPMDTPNDRECASPICSKEDVIDVKCCNSIHNYVEVIQRFDLFMKNKNSEVG